jgi:hypothetical protein
VALGSCPERGETTYATASYRGSCPIDPRVRATTTARRELRYQEFPSRYNALAARESAVDACVLRDLRTNDNTLSDASTSDDHTVDDEPHQ